MREEDGATADEAANSDRTDVFRSIEFLAARTTE
jgi:hypothetical protein